jgi:hypothetical protein
MTVFTAVGGQAAAERLTSKQRTLIAFVISFDNHLERKLRDSMAVTGVTLEPEDDPFDGFCRAGGLL